MKEESKRWINAAIILGKNPNAKVSCPRCGQNYLKVEDVQIANTLERHLMCLSCNATNSILIRTEKENN